MMTLADLARRDGVSKPTVSAKVKRLCQQHGLEVERDHLGRVSAINVAHYDSLLERTSDPSKAQGPQRAAPISLLPPGEDSYDEALRKKTVYEGERKRIDLERQKGNLVEVARVADAAVTCATTITRTIDRLPNAADDIAAAVARDGAHGVRVLLKTIAAKMRADVADALAGLSGGANPDEPEPDEPE
ncbi:ArsR family transcriptional regulator [Camelimonas fluminis]|uniref:ArsR family transcriptional regulator n=1 Tax=Camelimonas fluminis TaxID=1576911 RepID=A0ABV7UEF1_9HYPH|nr:ArsR family transcriptional regulator [Camelimonas fluminis]